VTAAHHRRIEMAGAGTVVIVATATPTASRLALGSELRCHGRLPSTAIRQLWGQSACVPPSRVGVFPSAGLASSR